jgi:hypothetical protein
MKANKCNMKKSIQYARNGAIILGVGNGLLNVVRQLDEMNNNPELKFDWQAFFKALGSGALIGVAAGYGVGWIVDYNNAREQPIDLDKYLRNFSNSLMLDKTDAEFKRLQIIANQLIKGVCKYFGDAVQGDPILHGSTEKGTALHDAYDIDVAIPFKPKSFPNNEEMFAAVYSFFKDRVGKLGIVEVRKQKRSIGVYIEIKGNGFWIDFAPYKLSKVGKSSGYLYVNKRNLLFNNSTIQKTDISKLKKTKLSDTQKKIVVILKDWKNRNDLPLSSHLMEYLVLDAYKYNRGNLPGTLTKKVIFVINHIADNIEYVFIRGVENTNNILTKNLGIDEKEIIISACKSAIKAYEYQPNSLTKTFQ